MHPFRQGVRSIKPFRKNITLPAVLLAASLLLLSAGGPADAQERRVALVVGNGAYQKLAPLRNPANDAEDTAAALAKLGFDVVKVVNGSYARMMDAVETFGRRLKGADAGLFYYAGHGVQSAGVNYLLPVDADISEEYQLRFKAPSADYVLEAMNTAGSKLNVVILDACRDNPFASFRRAGRGLAVIGNAPPGAVIVYATDPGKAAADGRGRNGSFYLAGTPAVAPQALRPLHVSASFESFPGGEPLLNGITLEEMRWVDNNPYYKQSMRFLRDGAYITASFLVEQVRANAQLRVIHLSSASASARNGGWAPITITINGRTVVADHSPALHGYMTEVWNIGTLLQQGRNTIKFHFDNSQTHYWLQRFEIVGE